MSLGGRGRQHKPKANLYQIKAKLYLLCDTLTSSVTLKTPDVTKLSWKPKCPGETKTKKKQRHKQKTSDNRILNISFIVIKKGNV